MLFAGDGDRVTVELDRITFTEVRAGDSGRYTVRARNRAGEGIAHTDLKGIYIHILCIIPRHMVSTMHKNIKVKESLVSTMRTVEPTSLSK